jgi:hypothetical protein
MTEPTPELPTVCTCLHSPGDQGHWEDPHCPTHSAA